MLKASSDSAINDFRISKPPQRAAYPRGSKVIDGKVDIPRAHFTQIRAAFDQSPRV
jgi:hypothetical protein